VTCLERLWAGSRPNREFDAITSTSIGVVRWVGLAGEHPQGLVAAKLRQLASKPGTVSRTISAKHAASSDAASSPGSWVTAYTHAHLR
jgi:hypothetical protein